MTKLWRGFASSTFTGSQVTDSDEEDDEGDADEEEEERRVVQGVLSIVRRVLKPIPLAIIGFTMATTCFIAIKRPKGPDNVKLEATVGTNFCHIDLSQCTGCFHDCRLFQTPCSHV